MSWIQTFSGKKFYPLAPDPDDIDRVDIAHALSHLCRFGGHSHQFYSVAEHCVIMSHAIEPEWASWALLHDAAEAYVVDIPRPLKRQLPDYRAIENNVLGRILERFGLIYGTPPDHYPGNLLPLPVQVADSRILLTERNVLLPNTTERWEQEDLGPLPVHIECLSPREAKAAYIIRMKELNLV